MEIYKIHLELISKYRERKSFRWYPFSPLAPEDNFAKIWIEYDNREHSFLFTDKQEPILSLKKIYTIDSDYKRPETVYLYLEHLGTVNKSIEKSKDFYSSTIYSRFGPKSKKSFFSIKNIGHR